MPLPRREFIATLAALAFPLPTKARAAEVTVVVGEELGTISPRIYGHFAEHIGTLIYGGIWVGPNSKIPNRDGYRRDVLDALARVRPAVVRWPGGCFADAYHWEDGVGPPADRKPRRNHWWQRDEPNTFGTDEFLRWCELLGTEPYLSVNVGTGTVDEALRWLEYCNGSPPAELAAARVKNGREKPYGVKWWGIGNENWGCGGLMTPDEYAQQFRQFSVYFKRLGLTTDLELVGVGHTADDWNRKFLAAAGPGLPYLDHLSIHRYFTHGPSTGFSDADYLDLMLDVSDFEKTINDALAAIDEIDARRMKMPVFGPLPRKPMGLIIDEWGVWHRDAKLADGFRQPGALREALFAASCLNLFHRHAKRITMTNIAQVLNCLHSLLLADDDALVLTPTYHVYDMYRAHHGATALRIEIGNTPNIARGPRSQPALSVSASRGQDRVLITVVNQDASEEIEATISLRGAAPSSASATILSAETPHAQNTRAAPLSVSPKRWDAPIADGLIRLRLPKASVVAVQVTTRA